MRPDTVASETDTQNTVLLLRDRIAWRTYLHIEVADVEGVVFDEAAAGFDVVAHEDGEDLVGADGVVEDDFEHLAVGGVHGGVEELVVVHFAEAFVALDGNAFLSALTDGVEEFGEGVDGGLLVGVVEEVA